MRSSDGDIKVFDSPLEAKAAGYDTSITPEEAEALKDVPPWKRKEALWEMRWQAKRKRDEALERIRAHERANAESKAFELKRKRNKAARRARKRNRRGQG